MNSLDYLYEYANEIGISLHDIDMDGEFKGICLQKNNKRAIVLDKLRINSTAE
jgi:hypothetical protein